MRNENIQHLNSLKTIHQKRLHILEKQAARYGDLAIPPHIEIEIEELKIKIADIDLQIAKAANSQELQIDNEDTLVALRSKLEKHFSLQELNTLCFDLGIDSENFLQLKESFTRELVSYCFRRGIISKVVNYCKNKRPNVAW